VAFRTLLDYVTVDLSAFYLDVIKDRLYCDAADGASRRSAQTVVYLVGRALAMLAAPMLCFTAEDVWRHLPRRPGDPDSVHLALLPEGAPLDEAGPLAARWTRLLGWRARAQKALEAFRAEKHHPLDARVVITPPAAERAFLAEHLPALPDLFVVSQVALDAADAPGAEPVLAVLQAAGRRCERCWKYTEAAGELCARCAAVVGRR